MKIVTNVGFDFEERLIPKGWVNNLLKEQKIGGILLVFVEGKTKKELKEKVSRIKKFCKVLHRRTKK